jgi:hypothetical protein
MSGTLGLFPFLTGEILRVALFAIHQPTRHLPAVFKIELTRYVPELQFEMGQIDRLHFVGFDPRPNDMGVSPPVFFMEDDGAGLAFQPQFGFDVFDSGLEDINRNPLLWGRAEAKGEQKLFGAGSPADRMDFMES